MKRISSADRNQIRFKGRHPAGTTGLILLLFFGIPVGMFSLIILNPENGVKNGGLIVAGISLLPLFAVLLSTMKRVVVCDLRRNQVAMETRLAFVPIKTQVYSNSTVDLVRVERQQHSTKNGSYYTYPVMMVTQGKDAQLGNLRDEIMPRTLAEACAKALQVRMTDQSSGSEVVREWDELDMSIRERAAKRGETPSLADIPEPVGQFKGQARLSGSELTVPIPSSTLDTIKKFVPFVIILGMLQFVGMFIFIAGRGKMGSSLSWQFMVPFLIFATVLIVVAFKVVGGLVESVKTVKATPGGLTLGLGSKQVTLNADDIEELNVKSPGARPAVLGMYGGSITVRTDTQTYSFGANCSGAELQWLHSCLFAILAGE